MLNTWIDLGDLALIFKVTVGLNRSNLNLCCLWGHLISLKTILVHLDLCYSLTLILTYVNLDIDLY